MKEYNTISNILPAIKYGNTTSPMDFTARLWALDSSHLESTECGHCNPGDMNYLGVSHGVSFVGVPHSWMVCFMENPLENLELQFLACEQTSQVFWSGSTWSHQPLLSCTPWRLKILQKSKRNVHLLCMKLWLEPRRICEETCQCEWERTIWAGAH